VQVDSNKSSLDCGKVYFLPVCQNEYDSISVFIVLGIRESAIESFTSSFTCRVPACTAQVYCISPPVVLDQAPVPSNLLPFRVCS
jgi:hypothetical protein